MAKGAPPASPRARSRRERSVSEGERALWGAYVALNGVAALPGRAVPPTPVPEPVPEAPADADPAPTKRQGAKAPVPALVVGKGGAGLDERRWRDLRRGKTRPERRLDLHGRRAEEAHALVLRFVRDAHADGVRLVEIVTGKGSGEGGVLRRELPHWLNLPTLRPLILGAVHPGAENTGAVRVLLRRRRQG
ncbi:Smr/MutS family protein [Roseomonas sp. CCTCC AB2023176]|uniref:Smr/MutS family protein n=1 Tax=Roseomonas sp. CCTCC AB2023176 TaxID=3342640 RepID=UPI0035D6F179